MITIRSMEIDDIDAVCVIEKELFSSLWGANGFFSFLIQEGTHYLVAEEDGCIRAYCGVMSVLDEADITNVAVAKACQRRGIGRQLMQAMCTRMEEQGVKKLYLEVRQSNLAAIGLYESLGFSRYGVRKAYYSDPCEDGILMMKKMQVEI